MRCSPGAQRLMTTSLVLASASPRRRQIIASLGLPVTFCVPPADEEAAEQRYRGPAEEMAQWLAKHKLASVHTLPEYANCMVISADTTVLLNDTSLGKPRDKAHARELLLTLRGRWHHVVTGIAVSYLLNGKRQMRSASCITPVLMRSYSEAEIAAYIASGDPLDKAGAYGIQHPSFQPTARINGCYLNVVGLPLCVLVDLMSEFNVYPVLPRSSLIDSGRGEGCPWSDRCLL